MPLLIPAVQAAREARRASDSEGVHNDLKALEPVTTFQFASGIDTEARGSRLFVGNLSFDSGDAVGNASQGGTNLNQFSLGVHTDVSPFEPASDWLL
jgi:hypothetical protein